MELLILGSNAAAFAYGRHHTAQILNYNSKCFLIDCGEATQLQIKRYHVKLSKIHCILISHLHGDHYLGLTGLLNTMHLYGREKKLILIGPPGLSDIITLQFRLSKTTLTYPIEFREWVPETEQLVYEDHKLIITTIPLRHKVDCSGYLFREKPKTHRIDRQAIPIQLSPLEIGRLKRGENILDMDGNLKHRFEDVTLPPLPSLSYAFCSDTQYIPDLAEKLKHVDLIYHESSFLEDMADRAETTKHSTAKQAAMVARDAGAKSLLLGHFSSRYKELDGFLEEAKSIFENTRLAIEGETFVIGT